ncbi:hypothetical protein D3C86_1862340 [compost metagenome]
MVKASSISTPGSLEMSAPSWYFLALARAPTSSLPFWTEKPGTVAQPARRKRLSRLPAVIFEIVRFIMGFRPFDPARVQCGVQILLFRSPGKKVAQG